MNALLKPRKADVSMLSDIFWHPYFNIFGELFVDDADKGKGWVTFAGKCFGICMLSINNASFLHPYDKVYGKIK